MRAYRPKPAVLAMCALMLLFVTADASAALQSQGVFDDVLNKFREHATTWGDIFKQHASWLFMLLASISIVWTFGMMALRKADIGEFFAELVRFGLFTGFFWWLLEHGPEYANAIIQSLTQIGGAANRGGGFETELSPSGIVDIGFLALGRSLVDASLWSPVDSVFGFVMALGILVIMTLIAVNMLLLLVSAWILAYAGIFFLGFGGSRWTSEMAINYYKTVLGIGVQIMTMMLLVGIGNVLINDYYNRMSGGVEIQEMAVVLVVAIILFVLTNKVPQLISGIANGASIGGMGVGSFAGGAAVGAAMGAAGNAIFGSQGGGGGGGSDSASAGGKSGGALAKAVAAGMANSGGAMKAIGAAVSGAWNEQKGTGGSPLQKAMGIADGAASRIVGQTGSAIMKGISNTYNAADKAAGDSAAGKLASNIKGADAAKNAEKLRPFKAV